MSKSVAIVIGNPLVNMELPYPSDEGLQGVELILDDAEAILAEGASEKGFSGFAAGDWVSYTLLAKQGACSPLGDHAALRAAMSDSSLKQPRFVVLEEGADVPAVVSVLNPPLLIRKGLDERYVEYLEDVSLAVNQLRKVLPEEDRVVVEEVVDGDGFSLYGFVSEDGFQLAGMVELEWYSGRGQYPMGLQCPAEMSEALRVDLIREAQEIVSLLDEFRGHLRMDFVVRDDVPYIKTIDPCIISSWMPVDLLGLSGAYPLWKNVLRFAAGEPYLSADEKTYRAAVLRWVSAGSGEVASVMGVDVAEKIEGVTCVRMRIQPGDRLRHAVDMRERDRVGYVVAEGDTIGEARAIAHRAADAIRIETNIVIESTEFK
ncbi:MAG: hypothetical protein COA73_16865 [Candidatus Hydrogenedentota bacterium]|nr:MAG: hypothetical protein COA73_16865 [Candidatus Hydrogenedentota bacterium]